MYFASNWDNTGGAPFDSLAIWRWYEDSNLLHVWNVTVPAWTPTSLNAHCGTPNWLAHSDMRLLAGARYEVNSSIGGSQIPGRKVLGWWWNVAEGGGFTFP